MTETISFIQTAVIDFYKVYLNRYNNECLIKSLSSLEYVKTWCICLLISFILNAKCNNWEAAFNVHSVNIFLANGFNEDKYSVIDYITRSLEPKTKFTYSRCTLYFFRITQICLEITYFLRAIMLQSDVIMVDFENQLKYCMCESNQHKLSGSF